MSPLQMLVNTLGVVLVVYCLLYNSVQLAFVAIAFAEVKRKLRAKAYEDLDVLLESPFTPPVSLIVPAYNEEKTVVASLESLMRLRFPRMELIVVNDGSSDGTLDAVVGHFGLRRVGIDYEQRIGTVPVRGFYERRTGLPGGVIRFILVDKGNGGKADALNAGINASTCPYFVSMDADSIIDEDALLQSFRAMLADERIVVIGGQVAPVNGCKVESGRITGVGLPRSSLARFQVLEYIRSFTIGRTALGRLDSILIISGVFGIFQKDIALKAGGYLSRALTSKVVREYVGGNKATVCEDMEIIVRIQRYIKEKKLNRRVGYTPYPLCWTEVPESVRSLAKQRNRWTRGLMETMYYHRGLLFSRRHGRLGWAAYPFFLFFELMGAPVELLGYLLIPAAFATGMLSPEMCGLFFACSVVYGSMVTVAALMAAAWREQGASASSPGWALLRYGGRRVFLILAAYSLLENLGYRQLNLWWRARGIWSWIRKEEGWQKFERKGFQAPEPG